MLKAAAAVYFEAALSLAIIGWIDFAVGREVSLWCLYLLPVGYVAWSAGLVPGCVFACAAAGWTLVLQEFIGNPYISELAWFTETLNQALVYLGCALLAARWHDSELALRGLAAARKPDAGALLQDTITPP